MTPREYAFETLKIYWPQNGDLVDALPVDRAATNPNTWPPKLKEILLPRWARKHGVDDMLLVPIGAVPPKPEPDYDPDHGPPPPDPDLWKEVDWWQAVYWYLAGCAELSVERYRGPIHSYSGRLKGFDKRMWERAWVNRIGLFLRAWAAEENRKQEEDFGEIPKGRILLTHDVDAVSKTPAIRIKQSAFRLFNVGRDLLRLRAGPAMDRLKSLGPLLFKKTSWWSFEEIQRMEDQLGIRSVFFFYGGQAGMNRPPELWLFDPDYDVNQTPLLRQKIQQLEEHGWGIGVHQSWGSWKDVMAMRRERSYVQQACGQPLTTCRQHWLRFSWRDTWRAQEEAGFQLDTTLGFNDRPGFRNGAALRFSPYLIDGPLTTLKAIPMMLMDSHIYDYQTASDPNHWIDEVIAVGGEASVIWHQQVFNADFGWGEGYRKLLEHLTS